MTMRTPKYAGLMLGLVLSILVAGVALAGRSTGHVVNASPGWNTPIFNNTSSMRFGINNCQSSANNLTYDWMHHWPIIPSTGTSPKSLACVLTNDVKYASWSAGGTADYSVEYTHANSATITNYWSADY
jgi:hypothetical protein